MVERSQGPPACGVQTVLTTEPHSQDPTKVLLGHPRTCYRQAAFGLILVKWLNTLRLLKLRSPSHSMW